MLLWRGAAGLGAGETKINYREEIVARYVNMTMKKFE